MIIILRGRVSVGQEGEQTGSIVRPQSVQVHGMWCLLDVEGFHYPPVCKVGFDLLYCSRLPLHLVSGVPCVDCYTILPIILLHCSPVFIQSLLLSPPCFPQCTRGCTHCSPRMGHRTPGEVGVGCSNPH